MKHSSYALLVLMLSGCPRPDTVKATPFVLTFGNDDLHAYRVAAPQPDGQLEIGPVVWEHASELQCRHHEDPQLRSVGKELVLSIHWETSDLVEVCEPDGCMSGHMDCNCVFDCRPVRNGVCELVLDPETFAKLEERGNCSG